MYHSHLSFIRDTFRATDRVVDIADGVRLGCGGAGHVWCHLHAEESQVRCPVLYQSSECSVHVHS